MSEFVDECRAEWRRLGVTDTIANEMAADLGADLDEAAADGVSAEEVLGTAAFDPRGFAASWARERGVLPVSPVAPSRSRAVAPPPRRFVVSALAVVGALALFAAAFALVLGGHHGGSVAVRPGPVVPGPGQVELVSHHVGWFDAMRLIALLAVVAIGAALTTLVWWAWRRWQPPTTPA
jgi:hypothetical protein